MVILPPSGRARRRAPGGPGRAALRAALVGGLVGLVVGGAAGRLLMRALRATSDADGVTTDDGFTIGEATLSGTLTLLVGMALAGAALGVVYVVVRPLLHPRLRVPVWALLCGGVGGGMFVDTDGLDLAVVEPTWLAVAGFTALPATYGAVTASLLERGGEGRSRVAPMLVAAGTAVATALGLAGLVDLARDVGTLA